MIKHCKVAWSVVSVYPWLCLDPDASYLQFLEKQIKKLVSLADAHTGGYMEETSRPNERNYCANAVHKE